MRNVTLDEFGNTLVLFDLLHHPKARIYTDRLHVLGEHKHCGGQMQSCPISETHVVLTCNGGCHFHAHAPRSIETPAQLQKHFRPEQRVFSLLPEEIAEMDSAHRAINSGESPPDRGARDGMRADFNRPRAGCYGPGNGGIG